MVFRDSADQLFNSSVQDEIAFGLRRVGCSRSAIQGRIDEVLSMVRLEGFENRVPLHLSGGERKRLALACVLAMEPEMLILDEPTAGRDPQGQALFLEILKNLKTTILLVSHDIFLVNELTNRTLIMDQGQIIHDLTTRDFMRDESLSGLNGLAFSFRRQSSHVIRSLQQEHEHRHSHDHPRCFTHSHPGDNQKHDHIPSRYNDLDHPENHGPHDREHADHAKTPHD